MLGSIIRCINKCGTISVTLSFGGMSAEYTFKPQNIQEYGESFEIMGDNSSLTITPESFQYCPEEDIWLTADGSQCIALI